MPTGWSRTFAAQGLTLDWILETHVHADHLSAAPYLRDTLGGRIGIGAKITTVQHTFARIYNAERGFARDGSQFDHLFEDGETFSIGGMEAEYLATPGHTPACGSYRVGDNIFVGDTLFMPDYGTARCDFPGGDARTMYRSIRRILCLSAADRALALPRLRRAGPRGLCLADDGGGGAAGRIRRSATASARTSSWRCARRRTPRSARRGC